MQLGLGNSLVTSNNINKYPKEDLQVIVYNQPYEEEGTTYLRTSIGTGIPKVSGIGLDTIWDFSVLEDARFDKGSYVGNAYGLPEYYDYPYVNIYYDDTSEATRYHWKLTDFTYYKLQVQMIRDTLDEVFFMNYDGTKLFIYESQLTGNNLSKILNHCSIFYYGILINENDSDPDRERVGRMEYHVSLPVQEEIKGCLQNADGSVNYYLDENDWSKKADGTASDLTGADGNVMDEVGEYYRKTDFTGNGHYFKLISWHYYSDFQKINKFYVGAYKAALNRTGTIKMWSVVNDTAEYRGGNNDDTLDGTDATQLGKPATRTSLIDFRSYARNIVSEEYKWNVITWKHSMLLYELFFIEFATLNSQKAVVADLTAEGYKQGGLGNGTTTVNSTDWSNFNSYYPLVPCGSSNNLGNNSGETDYTINNFGGAGVDEVVKVNRYRGVENPFGDIWELCDGASVNHGAATSDFYTCETPANFDDGTESNYTKRSELPTSNGYLQYAHHDNYGIITPKVAAGNSATYFCDYFYTPGLNSGWRAVLRGGLAHNSSTAGFAYLYSNISASTTYAYFGARLCYIP